METEVFKIMSEKVKVTLEKNADFLRLPTIALRGLVVFPNNVIHFEVGRQKSIAAIEWAMNNSSNIFLVAQKEMDMEDPNFKDLFSYGVVAEVKQILRVSEDLVKVLVEGKSRAKLINIDASGKFLLSTTKLAPVHSSKNADATRLEALVRSIKDTFEEYLSLSPRISKDTVYHIITNESPAFLCEYIPANILLKYTDKQDILNENSVLQRLERLLSVLRREVQVLSIERDIDDKVNEAMEKNQRDYYLREQMRAISNELEDSDDTRVEAIEYKEKIEKLALNDEIREKLLKEVDRLYKLQGSAQEAGVVRTYLDTCIALPWGVYTDDKIDINAAEKALDKEHYGLKKVKERILEILAVRKLAPNIKGQIICLVGPPGVGKTSIAQSIAKCLGRKYARISLGGVRDEAEIRGHRRTYIGALPGKIISAVTNAKSANALILLDEVDKLANDFRGDPASALLEVLDPEQNFSFKDHYLDLPFDLSKILFITTANTLDTIPRPLLDRMDVIELSSYTRIEKFNIAKKHLLPKQLVQAGLKGIVKVNDKVLYSLIDSYTKESGVRSLERTIAELLRKCAKKVAANDCEKITLYEKNVEPLLGPKRVKPGFLNKENAVGVANGLAWTSVGGELLPIEVQLIENGTGKLELTGSLGDVMKESAKLAITFARSNAKKYSIDEALFKNLDIHIHAPEGAVPKDGPSAGVTLTTALVSALSNRKVRCDIAMTGEITLHGQVLAIGGLKEKSMAAYREGMRQVLIPSDNVPDLYEVDDEVKKVIEFVPVQNLSDVLHIALCSSSKNTGKEPIVNSEKKPQLKSAIVQ